jgi:hypothetical protein
MAMLYCLRFQTPPTWRFWWAKVYENSYLREKVGEGNDFEDEVLMELT